MQAAGPALTLLLSAAPGQPCRSSAQWERNGVLGSGPTQAPLIFPASVTTESLLPTPSPEISRWSLVRTRVMELVKPLVTRTRDRWQRFWVPGAVQGFVQTYYEDHLKDLGPRTQAWLQSSRDQLLNKTHSLCPRLLCRD
ncbi:apolipoprotein C-II isoform X2 [Arvicola amphibius]|uniref:apolipoprotein C-II isoform X2 n=1 Tax=Arvicola amphibius TaxID=1047088 RepID=UPI0018E2D47E|nr:apolipoprotein C-II isoform X2 [Arvicola amphibius]